MSSNSLAIVPQYQDPQMLQTIKDTVCKGASESQFRMFIEVCKATGLNPFLKEIYYAPQIGVMASRDGYLRKANDHPQFDGMETRVERDEKNIPIKAVCSVWRKDRNHPVICEAYFNEYKKASQVWQQYPSAMIAKVAEVLALKRSFAINGVVTEEEVGEQGSKEAQKDYLAEKGLTPYVKPDVRKSEQNIKNLIIEGAQMIDPPRAPDAFPQGTKTIEMRHAATVAEADAQLKEVAKPKKAAPKLTADSIEIRKGFTNMKDMLREITGDDGVYRNTLRAYGFESSKDIPTRDEGRIIYKAMGELLNRARDEKKLKAELELSEAINPHYFKNTLGAWGCLTIEDVLCLSSEPLEGLRKQLKEAGTIA